MVTSDDSSSSQSSVAHIGQAHEYFEEVDDHTLDIRKRKAPATLPIKSLVKEPPTAVDPIKKLNEQLNRKFRPDLIPPTPLQPPPDITAFLPSIRRTPSPDPIIFDSRAKPVKSPKRKKEPSISIKQKLFNRVHQLTARTPEPAPFSSLQMSHQPTMYDNYPVPPGMMLVPAPQQTISTMTGPSQQPQAYAMTSQYLPPTVAYTNSLKHNKVAPPPSLYNTQAVNTVMPNNSFQSPSSMMSTNPLIQSTYMSQQVPKYVDQSKPNKKKQKKRLTANSDHRNDPNRSFALYNQNNGRIEGLVKNRLNVVPDEAEGNKITDDDPESKGKWAVWLAQPLWLGLTRLSGGILFGSMALLGAASIAGLIASIATYTQDSTTDAQWKILGMVVCAIMLITIIVTLLIFICCYKHGYMFNKDDDIDPTDPSTTQDAEGNERHKAVLRKIYKFNRPNDTSSIPSDMLQDVPTPISVPQPVVYVNDKQTNTETTIAQIRPRDFDRGVWPSTNVFNGISYRPLVQPHTVSRFIQVFPHEIEEAFQGPQVIYQVVAPAAAIPPPQIQPRIIQMPVRESSVVEVIETTRKQPRTTIIRQPQTQQIVVQPTTRIEYVDVEEEQQPQQRTRRIIQQPQYEIVEEIVERPSSSSSSMEEYVEIVDEPKRVRQHGRKKGRKQNFGKISVKHVKPAE